MGTMIGQLGRQKKTMYVHSSANGESGQYPLKNKYITLSNFFLEKSQDPSKNTSVWVNRSREGPKPQSYINSSSDSQAKPPSVAEPEALLSSTQRWGINLATLLLCNLRKISGLKFFQV